MNLQLLKSWWLTTHWKPKGANDPWQLAQLERAFQLRQVRNLCMDGARVADFARVDIRGVVTVGRDVEIDADVIFEGTVRLGDGVRIGPFLPDQKGCRHCSGYGGACALRY